ncbi:sugar phosphate permease [Trueperella bonasi]|uniref:Sugar phosphate permease n=1 Tax=Trueperella bonasi TaxID=312286 RepID=A0ABT9NHY0_9ACTO|nr:sugar phosphate permease [Trueperella bonasi]
MTRHKVAVFVWLIAVAVYAVAVAGRTSFGVAGLTAIDRFDISAATLSLFTVVQVGVYAAAQIPVGLLLDKFGPRVLLGSGAIILAAGQVGMALADTVGFALAARVLVGLGDATAFTSVIRIVPSWFAPRRAPLFTQLTGIIGGLGQFISSVPFAYLLANVGWAPAFGGLAILGVAVSGLAFAFIRDTPKKWTLTHIEEDDEDLARQMTSTVSDTDDMTISQTLREPASWLGFWTHWVGNFPQTVFLLLWGVPFLQIHQGMSQAGSSAILLVVTGAAIILGPLVGELTARHSMRRIWIVNGISCTLAAVWALVLVLPAPAPLWMIVVLLVVIAATGPASSIGFDYARTSIPVRRLGTANGLINMGGFIAALITAWLIGVVLDWSSQGAPLGAGDFKLAMSTQVFAWIVGMVMLEVFRRKTRKRDAERGITVPPLRKVIARYQARFEARKAAAREAKRRPR